MGREATLADIGVQVPEWHWETLINFKVNLLEIVE